MLGLREMKLNDSMQIAELEQEIFTDAWTQEGIEETFSQSHAFIAVAEEDSKIQGYCIIYVVLDEAEIARIGVTEHARCSGVGSGILQFCEAICKEKGVERLLLDVREGNLPARKFYEKHGFLVDGVRKNFYDNPKEDGVLMSKGLGQGIITTRISECIAL